ncbi:MAG: hypothetical protein AAFX06_29815 [Planctomycetota bacterium]
MTLISSQKRLQYRAENTRPIALISGAVEDVYMPPSLWIQYEALLSLEGISEADIAELALEEMPLQKGATFADCFRAVVTWRVNDWLRVTERMGLTVDTLGRQANDEEST